MAKEEIEVLLQLAKSNKEYGKKSKHDRLIQGSKGLGFLSVFKFGSDVTWITKSEGENAHRFGIIREEVVKCDNIAEYDVELFASKRTKRGTTILIKLDEYNVRSLKKYFSDEKNSRKILYAFDDSRAIVDLIIDGKKDTSEVRPEILKIEPGMQFLHIMFDSDSEKVLFFYGGKEICSMDSEFKSNRYKLSAELLFYRLTSGGKSKIDPLFYNPKNEDLTPLIYVNDGIFNNYDLYDPNIMGTTKTGKVIRQVIGYIRIKSSDKMIEFNSDRSRFVQNELTDEIMMYVRELNKKIQEEAATIKSNFNMDFIIGRKEISADESKNIDFLKGKINDAFLLKSLVTIEVSEKTGYVRYRVGEHIIDLTIKKPVIVPAFIKIIKTRSVFEIPTEQIDLRNRILEAKNSDGHDINLDDIRITCEYRDIEKCILESVSVACTRVIRYEYTDSKTGPVIEEEILSFIEKREKINVGTIQGELIHFPANGYEIKISRSLNNLVKQINGLNYKENWELAACSLRCVFELTIRALVESNKGVFGDLGKDVGPDIKKIIEHILDDNKIVTEISKSTGMKYPELLKILRGLDVEKIASVIQLGAHSSTTFLAENDITSAGTYAGVFITVVSDLMNNPNL